MRIKILLSFVLIMIALFSMAADISFVIYNVSGIVKKTSGLRVKKGDKLLTGETLVLADKASVILICSNYKTIQLNKKGYYAAGSLKAQCNKDAAGYSSAYFKYVWDEFTHPHGKPETDPGKYMKNVGAVSRGCNSLHFNMAVDTIHYHEGELNIRWSSIFDRPLLAVYDVPVDGGPLKKTALQKDGSLSTRQIADSLSPGEYYWQIIDAEGNGCERNYLKIWDKTTYNKQVEDILNSVPKTNAAETAFARGFLFQQNHFLKEALQQYQLATELEPRNKDYKKFLHQFYADQF